MDDGSAANCLSRNSYEQIQSDIRPELKKSAVQLRSAVGTGLEVYGEVQLPVQIGKKVYLVEFVVCDITEEAILGKPFQRRNKVVVYHHLCKIKIDKECVPCFDKWSKPLNTTVRLAKSVTIDSGEEYSVPGKVYFRSSRNKRAMVIGTTGFMAKNQVLVARVLVDPQVTH